MISKLDFNYPVLLLRNHDEFSWSYQNCLGLSLDFLGPMKLAEYRFCISGRFAFHCQSVRVFGNQEVKINAWKSRVTGRFVPGLSSLYWDRIISRFDSCFKRLYCSEAHTHIPRMTCRSHTHYLQDAARKVSGDGDTSSAK